MSYTWWKLKSPVIVYWIHALIWWKIAGELPCEKIGDVVGELVLNPWRRPTWKWFELYSIIPKRYHLKRKWQLVLVVSSSAALKDTLRRPEMMAFRLYPKARRRTSPTFLRSRPPPPPPPLSPISPFFFPQLFYGVFFFFFHLQLSRGDSLFGRAGEKRKKNK